MMPPGFGLLENGNGRPHMIKAPGTIGMPSPGRSVPEEVWDIKTTAAHRHMILVAESWSQRTEMEAQMRAIPPQAYPPGFRPPPQHSASLPQSCPSSLGPRVRHVERSTVMQPETKFCSGDPIIYRQESYLDNRPRDPVGIHGTMWGSYMYGAAYRHGWYPNESSSGAGGVCGSGFVAPSVSKPHILAREPEDGHVLNLYRGAVLENENWRRDTHRQNGQSLSPIPVSNATPPLASYTEAVWLGKIFGSTRDAGKRCSFDGSDNTSPPFKRLRIGHEVDSPSWVRSRRESEIAWLNDLQMSGDRSLDCEASYPSSLLTLKQTERRNKTESSDGNVDRWHDRQELRTRRSSPHYQSGSLSPRDRNRAPIILEGTQKSELFSRPSSFRVISQSDRSTLRASPRPVYSNGKEKQFRNNPCFDARSWPSNCGSWSPRLNRRSQSPNSRSNYGRRSLRVGECSWRRDSWPPRLLAGRSGSGAETDKHVALWRSADCAGEVEKKMQEDGSLISLHFSQVVEEHAKDDRSPSDFQSLDVRAKQKSQRGTEDHLVQMVNNFSDNMALASIDRIKNDKALSLPLRAGTIQKFVEMEPEAEQCDSLEKNLPLHRNGSQFYDEKAGLSCGKHMTTIGENRSASIQPISATSLKIVRCFTNARSALKYRASQDSEVNWNISPVKVTPRRRRTVVVSAGPSLVKRSGSDEGAALPTERQDEAGEILHTENSSKSSLGSRFLLEGSSIASEIRINQGSLMKPFVGLLRVSSEVTVHPPSVVRGTDSQVTTVRKVASCGSQRAGKKWISPGLRSRHIPKAKLLKTASGSNLQSPKSLGKSRTFGGCLLAKDAPGCSWSQQTEGVSPTLTVRNGRVSFRAGVKRLSDNSCVPRADLSVQDKNQEIYTAGKIESDVASFKDSSTVPETQKPKLPFMAEKFFLQESTVHGQNSERDHLVKSETEGQLMSSCLSSVGDMRVNPVVGKSGLLLDDWLFRITSSIPLAIESNKGFQPNGSTSESSPVFAKSGLQDRLTSEGDKQIEQLSGLFRGKSTSVIELAKVMTDKPKAAVMQGKQNTKVVSQFSGASGRGDKLARQLNREYKGQGNPTAKVASILTNAGASLVTEGTEVMSIVPQRSNLQDLTNPGGNTQAEQQGKVSMGDAGLATKLVRVMTGEGEATLTDGEDDFEVITEPSGVVVTTVLHFNRELGKRRKIMHPESRGNLKQVIIAVDPSAKVMKTNILESSGGIGKIKADSILMKKQMPSLNGGMQRTVSFLKTIDALSLPNRLSVPPAVTPPLYTSNKTWRREATPANSQQFSSTPQKPAVNTQPSTYVRKNFSIIRYPTSQVPPPSNVRAQPNALSKFPQGSVNQSRYKKYSLPASKSMGHHQVNTTIAKNAVAGAASANPNVNTLSTKMSELGAMPSEKPSPSPARRLHSVGDETLVTPSESIVLDLPPVSKISLSKPPHCEGSSDLTTLVCRPATKSHGRATDEAVGHVVSGTRLFRKRQSDQIHVGPSTTSASSILRPDIEKCDVPLGYIRRKINQLVRCDYAEASANDSLQNMMEGGDEVKFVTRQRRYSAQLKTKTKLCRVSNQKRATLLGLARVWTLSNEGKRTTTALGTSRDWRKPLLPWKRSDIVAPRLRQSRPLNEGKTGALFFYISNRLQKYRLAHPVYTRSADGFSLHRSGVMSKSGANLKWTKSLKTQSILASEAATKVVAEAEKKKRDKKEAVVMAVAKATDERREKLRSGSVDPSSVSSLKPLGIHRALYVRKGFGNELVRNSKTVARVVASEKFRWSLRNARLRRAKKQAFCVYYTRFGVCKRGDGKCLYIHDPEKVAVCTKFLRGSCSDPACHLTHKVIPERTSDCSYFLEGLCTNGSCPYRHVNVNKEAPICEAFLQGYCTDGDKCNKKHTYVCLQYTLTGSCSSSNCKLRHPKKIMLPTSASKDSVDSGKESQKGSKREFQKGRYFTLTTPVEGDRHGHPVSTAILGGKIAESGDDPVDFISID